MKHFSELFGLSGFPHEDKKEDFLKVYSHRYKKCLTATLVEETEPTVIEKHELRDSDLSVILAVLALWNHENPDAKKDNIHFRTE